MKHNFCSAGKILNSICKLLNPKRYFYSSGWKIAPHQRGLRLLRKVDAVGLIRWKIAPRQRGFKNREPTIVGRDG